MLKVYIKKSDYDKDYYLLFVYGTKVLGNSCLAKRFKTRKTAKEYVTKRLKLELY